MTATNASTTAVYVTSSRRVGGTTLGSSAITCRRKRAIRAIGPRRVCRSSFATATTSSPFWSSTLRATVLLLLTTGRADRTRTCNLRFWRPLLYHLSHRPKGAEAPTGSLVPARTGYDRDRPRSTLKTGAAPTPGDECSSGAADRAEQHRRTVETETPAPAGTTVRARPRHEIAAPSAGSPARPDTERVSVADARLGVDLRTGRRGPHAGRAGPPTTRAAGAAARQWVTARRCPA